MTSLQRSSLALQMRNEAQLQRADHPEFALLLERGASDLDRNVSMDTWTNLRKTETEIVLVDNATRSVRQAGVIWHQHVARCFREVQS